VIRTGRTIRHHIPSAVAAAALVGGLAAGSLGARDLEQATTAPRSEAVKPAAMIITLVTKPNPPAAGQDDFEVTVADAQKKPVTGVDVSVDLVMPAMPSMGMAEMKRTVALKPVSTKPADAGKYAGRGQVPAAGQWNVTVRVKMAGKELATKTLTLTAR
jgi:hypothetical protein